MRMLRKNTLTIPRTNPFIAIEDLQVCLNFNDHFR